MLEKEFQYYIDNQSDLLNKYNGKFIVIKGDDVIGIYETHADAYDNTIKDNELGTFLIQHCLPGTESYSQTFYSQVIIHALA